MRTCRHPSCGRQFKSRSGLGLCRTCWNKPEIRKLYQPLASFGGAEAGRLGYQESAMKNQPLTWHPFAELFPLIEGDEWEAFKKSIQKTNGNETPVAYRLVNGRKEGLDGRNRERACQELGLECTYTKVFLGDAEAKEFILRKNVHRRHMTRELRQQIVGDLRSEGKSTRQIAEVLGVNHSTIVRDINDVNSNSGGANAPPEPRSRTTVAGGAFAPPEPEKVTGSDGKTYPAKKPSREVETYAPTDEPEVETFGPGDAYEGHYDGPEEDDEPVAGYQEPTRPIPSTPHRKRKEGEQVNGSQYLEKDVDESYGRLTRMVNQRSVVFGKTPLFHATWRLLEEVWESIKKWRKEKPQ